MAGAVSAGAYTAGVLDYLFRALDAHAARVDRGPTPDDSNPPKHRVTLKVMSGASAGGVCSGLAIAALAKAQRPDPKSGEPLMMPPTTLHSKLEGRTQDVTLSLRALYDVWVDGLDLWDPVNGAGFLSLTDLESKDAPLRSALNSDHIDEVANNALKGIPWGGTKNKAVPFPFLASELELFLTTTSLQGIPYKVSFASSGNQMFHRMAQHSAVRHFRVTAFGTQHISSKWLTDWKDNGLGLPVDQIDGDTIPFSDPRSDWSRLKIASFASGAFPLGLAARHIDVTAQDFAQYDPDDLLPARGGALPIDIDPARIASVKPDFGDNCTPDLSVSYTAVDGGVANNEPFEYARFTLRDAPPPAPEGADASQQRHLAANLRDAHRADRAVIMIDPFPEGPSYKPMDPEDALAQRDLMACIQSLFPALLNQARFKPSELANASDKAVHSRFLIAPSRTLSGDKVIGASALACGGFGGFGGFLDKSFRLHDFILGQRNCQMFLKEHFTLAQNNKIFNDGREPAANAEPEGSRKVIDPGEAFFENEVVSMDWPGISSDRLDLILKQGQTRMNKVGMKVFGRFMERRLRAWLIKLISNIKLKELRQEIVRSVMCDLLGRDQHAAYQAEPAQVKAAVIALIARGSAPVTAKDLRAQILNDQQPAHATDALLEKDLMRLTKSGQVWSATSIGGQRSYVYAMFKPNVAKSMRLRLFGT